MSIGWPVVQHAAVHFSTMKASNPAQVSWNLVSYFIRHEVKEDDMAEEWPNFLTSGATCGFSRNLGDQNMG